MRFLKYLALLPLFCTGCTACALERYTINQIATITDLRFQAILDNLAAVAANPHTLPSYAPVGEGSAQISETVTLDPRELWTRATFKGFNSETLGLVATLNPQPAWTVDAVAQYQQVEALHYALMWAVCGPPDVLSPNRARLDLFQVSKDLDKLPSGWLGIGTLADVPACALYRAHCHGKWVWVTRDGMPGLSAFTLIVQDIVTVDLNSLNKQPPTLSLKIKYGDNADAPTVEAKVTKDVRPMIVPFAPAGGEGPPVNRIVAILGSPPSGLNLRSKSESFVLPSDLVLTTTQPPNVDPTGNVPTVTPDRGITPSYNAPRATSPIRP
jgi:hypothetical protein